MWVKNLGKNLNTGIKVSSTVPDLADYASTNSRCDTRIKWITNYCLDMIDQNGNDILENGIKKSASFCLPKLEMEDINRLVCTEFKANDDPAASNVDCNSNDGLTFSFPEYHTATTGRVVKMEYSKYDIQITSNKISKFFFDRN